MNIIVTGANAGIGYETVSALLTLNPENHIFLGCRDEKKANEAIEQLQKKHPNAKHLEFLKLDLGDLKSVKNCAESFIAKKVPLHILINNAGLMGSNLKTAQGYEGMFGINHLGHFLFTLLLLPVLKSSAPSRIVVVASSTHATAEENIDIEALPHRQYSSVREFIAGYSNSKLCNVFFTHALARRLQGSGVTVNALHPGTVKTSIGSDAMPWYLSPIVKLMKWFFLTPEDGAKTSLYVATSKDLEGVTGKYFDNCKETETKATAHDEVREEKLWDLSTALVQEYLN